MWAKRDVGACAAERQLVEAVAYASLMRSITDRRRFWRYGWPDDRDKLDCRLGEAVFGALAEAGRGASQQAGVDEPLEAVGEDVRGGSELA